MIPGNHHYKDSCNERLISLLELTYRSRSFPLRDLPIYVYKEGSRRQHIGDTEIFAYSRAVDCGCMWLSCNGAMGLVYLEKKCDFGVHGVTTICITGDFK